MTWRRPGLSEREANDLELAFNCLGVLRRLAEPEPEPKRQGETCDINDLRYARFVELPRLQGRDPMYEAMMAEALGTPVAEDVA